MEVILSNKGNEKLEALYSRLIKIDLENREYNDHMIRLSRGIASSSWRKNFIKKETR